MGHYHVIVGRLNSEMATQSQEHQPRISYEESHETAGRRLAQYDVLAHRLIRKEVPYGATKARFRRVFILSECRLRVTFGPSAPPWPPTRLAILAGWDTCFLRWSEAELNSEFQTEWCPKSQGAMKGHYKSISLEGL